MRQGILFALALLHCAPVVAPVSSPPPAASLPTLDESADNCDLQCQREILAGVELVIGDYKAETAREKSRADNNAKFARQLELHGKITAAVTAVCATIFGAAIGGSIAFVVLRGGVP